MVHSAMAGSGRCKCCNRGSEGPPPQVQTGYMVYTVKREGGSNADVPEKGDACVAPTMKTGTAKGGRTKAGSAKGVGPQAGTTNTGGPRARTGRLRFLPPRAPERALSIFVSLFTVRLSCRNGSQGTGGSRSCRRWPGPRNVGKVAPVAIERDRAWTARVGARRAGRAVCGSFRLARPREHCPYLYLYSW